MNNNLSPSERNSDRKAGKIFSYFSGVAKISGLAGVSLYETLVDKSNRLQAIVIGFDENFVDALFFDKDPDLDQALFRSGKEFSFPIGDSVVGRILDGLGKPIDGLGPVKGKLSSAFAPAPQIMERAKIKRPLSTGIKIIDTALPLGRGQRELIIGDRKIGKTSLALDIALNQKNAQPQVNCVYVLCGKKKRELQDIVSLFNKQEAFLYTTVVVATAEDSLASQYLAPFVGCALGEYFRDQGKDALVVYDDLSQHAKVYRSIALLLGRVPGRETYPGDIFSLHAGLLERSAQLSASRGGGSLTALPIAETEGGDITSFIPTNLISITDGHIYFENGLFQKGFLPAINVGLSVSRLGAKAQPKLLAQTAGSVRLALAQHKELQKLVQLETAISDQARDKIHRGNLVLELLKQDKRVRLSWQEEAVLFYAVEGGFFDKVEESQWQDFEELLLLLMRNRYQSVLSELGQAEEFTEELQKKIENIVKDASNEFLRPRDWQTKTDEKLSHL